MQTTLKQRSPLLVIVAWCVAMMSVRILYSGSMANTFLLWNLLLAVVPALAALALCLLPQRRGLFALQAAAFCVWLAFLPNAPYLVTDLVHLRHVAPIPLWFDVALFGSFAAAGGLLGYASVADVESVVSARFGSVVGSWVALGALLLCGFGIYFGRFLRWNSWDVLTSPQTLAREAAHQLVHPLSHPTAWEVSAVYDVGLAVGYVALRSVGALLAQPDRRAVV